MKGEVNHGGIMWFSGSSGKQHGMRGIESEEGRRDAAYTSGML